MRDATASQRLRAAAAQWRTRLSYGASRSSAEFVPTGRDSGQQAGVPGLGTLFSVSRMPLPNSHRLPDTSHRKGRHDIDKNRSTFEEVSRNVWCRIFLNSH